jgi:3-hexulose-6-phosphate synthase/6-phospho-3-hexuloisomerase
MAKLQLALDFADLGEALAIADKAAPYCDWLEAGTPLIKSEGLRSLRELKKRFPGKTIVADMKTMDTGAFEAGLAAKAGADVTTVCGAADMDTIKGAIEEGKRRGIAVAVDLINVPPARWQEIDSLKPDYICIHVGIDQQARGMDPLALLKKLKVRSKKIVAGGINAKSAPDAVKAGAEVVIVGGAITKAQDPAKAAKEIKEAMDKASIPTQG